MQSQLKYYNIYSEEKEETLCYKISIKDYKKKKKVESNETSRFYYIAIRRKRDEYIL